MWRLRWKDAKGVRFGVKLISGVLINDHALIAANFCITKSLDVVL